jgi:hypothetical protein
MKQIFTLFLLVFTIAVFAQQNSREGVDAKQLVSKTEIKIKQQQSVDLKGKCPHYPVSSSHTSGPDKAMSQSFESWKNNYPQEYEAYLKLFNDSKLTK